VVTHLNEAWHGERVVIVTGGSRGTGRDFARALAGAGYAVVIGYAHGQRDADATVEEILAGGGAAVGIRADVADELDVERLFLETREEFGGVELVVEAPGWLSELVQREAVRHVRAPGATVSFAGRGQAGLPADIVALALWLTARGRAGGESPVEVVALPVSDADRAKRFYQDLGWRLDAEETAGESFRVVQLTPPGWHASVVFGVGVSPAVPGSADGLRLPVAGEASGASFSDPDGNTWLLEGLKTRLPGR
jgi:hypothetical protein